MAEIEMQEIIDKLRSLTEADFDLFQGLYFEHDTLVGTIVKADANGFDVRDERNGAIRPVSIGASLSAVLTGGANAIDRLRAVTHTETPARRGARLIGADVDAELLERKLFRLCSTDYSRTRLLTDEVFAQICQIALGNQVDINHINEANAAVYKIGLKALRCALNIRTDEIKYPNGRPSDKWLEQYSKDIENL